MNLHRVGAHREVAQSNKIVCGGPALPVGEAMPSAGPPHTIFFVETARANGVHGKVFGCTSCDFDFSSGWSHHAGGQFLVCRECGTHYVLGGGESCWSARAGEHLQLQFLPCDAEGDVATGTQVTVRVRAVPDDEEWDGVSYLDFPELSCPRCNRADALVQSLEVNQPCPACHRGTIVVSGTCIY